MLETGLECQEQGLESQGQSVRNTRLECQEHKARVPETQGQSVRNTVLECQKYRAGVSGTQGQILRNTGLECQEHRSRISGTQGWSLSNTALECQEHRARVSGAQGQSTRSRTYSACRNQHVGTSMQRLLCCQDAVILGAGIKYLHQDKFKLECQEQDQRDRDRTIVSGTGGQSGRNRRLEWQEQRARVSGTLDITMPKAMTTVHVWTSIQVYQSNIMKFQKFN